MIVRQRRCTVSILKSSRGWKVRISAIVLGASCLLGTSFVASAAMAPAASAAVTKSADSLYNGCYAFAWWSPWFVCVRAMMGGKNYSNHTQWVGQVTTETPEAGVWFYHDEAWGDGFYRSGYSIEGITWDINRWVRSGTNICAKATDHYGESAIACIHISV